MAVKVKYRLAAVGVSVFLLIILYSTFYGDIAITTKGGLVLWDSIAAGKPLQFYNMAYAEDWFNTPQRNTDFNKLPVGAAYDYTLYIIFAIWNLPMWIIGKATGINVFYNFYCQMYMKSIMIVGYVFLGCALWKFVNVLWPRTKKTGIEKNDDMEYRRKLEFLFFYSLNIILIKDVFYISQYDVFGVAFLTLGMYYYVKNNMKKFFLAFTVAISIKYFSLIIFALLILLKEKRIKMIVLHIIQGLSLTLFWKILFLIGGLFGDKPEDSASVPGTENLELIKQLVSPNIKTGLFSTSLFLVISIIAILGCFLYNEYKEEEKRFNQACVLGFIMYGSMAVFTKEYPYWSVYVLPFMIPLIMKTNKEIRPFVILGEFFFTAGLFVSHWASYYWCFSPMQFNKMLIAQIVEGVTGQEFTFDKSVSLLLKTQKLVLGRSGVTFCFMGFFMLLALFLKGEDERVKKRLGNPEITKQVGIFGDLRIMGTLLLMFVPILMYIFQIFLSLTLQTYD